MMMDNNQSDVDDIPQLSTEALLALNQFYREQNETEDDQQFTEDWELSQFWYDEKTTAFLADQSIQCINGKGRIGCISCPTLYIKLLQMIKDSTKDGNDSLKDIDVYLLEYDQRFASLGPNFVYYDYREPLSVRDVLSDDFFDLIVCDPPFLSEECLEKITQTIKYLKKDKVMLNTGSVLADEVDRYLQLKPCPNFVPRHKNNLGNQFSCYTNFPLNQETTKLNHV